MTKFALSLCVASALTLTACTDPGYVAGSGEERDAYRQTKTGAVIGGLFGAGVAAATDNNVAIGAAVGAGVGAIIGSELDKQAAELREDLDDEVRIENTGDRLILTMPQDILFDIDSYTVSSGLRDDLGKVATSLNKYPDTTVQVLGHTDNTGSAEHNQALSERRANAVADVLLEGGVPVQRIETIGRGEDQPIASNLDEAGRKQNRRVEIVILPNAT
ncbi:OmpA family protein [Shimia abyssi]|uniref:Outer membrane protein OmpA-like peptidoglycan-associated protein n=1 Tax=Shimia abyssi TaxID=1662395 RepID=A0A2P8F9B8_9RHOB|nr:OmpA family protein [Shimia abyssi]PSL18317.1 outer membrane protein OmpA-like peptidoglycan-associated protein [Shimia abyssi]